MIAAQERQRPNLNFLREGANIPPRWKITENEAYFEVEMPSRTEIGVFYTVRVLKETNEMMCTCKGYHFNHRCAHIAYLIGVSKKGARRSGMQDTSLEAFFSFDQNELTERQEIVLDKLRELGPMSNKQIAAALNWPINTVTPRVLELRGKGIVVEHGDRISNGTGRKEKIWRALGTD